MTERSDTSPERDTDSTESTEARDEAAVDETSTVTRAFDTGATVEGKVIGWNKGGFHVVVDGTTAFCPRSEMELGQPREPKGYVDETYEFKVLEVRRGGSRVVLSRAAALGGEDVEGQDEATERSPAKLEVGAVVRGTVVSITDFGAFVELGGVQGLVHISELSRRHVEHPSDVVSEGDDIEVKILKIERGGRRISLSRKALEPDPWSNVKERLAEGTEVTGVVEKTERFGALIEIEPGLTGLLPTSQMSLPRDTSPVRAFPPGRQVDVQIVSIDPRRRRISLAPKGARTGGSQADVEAYKRSEGSDEGGFNALEAAFRKVRAEP
ncbi:MAG: S1 RNA-binding domain-containing protein [Thermoanaerobaculia bacterium]|nr:S1 RNA-binding domain-containing protein [Thermoanaerobaculia bacterium]